MSKKSIAPSSCPDHALIFHSSAFKSEHFRENAAHGARQRRIFSEISRRKGGIIKARSHLSRIRRKRESDRQLSRALQKRHWDHGAFAFVLERRRSGAGLRAFARGESRRRQNKAEFEPQRRNGRKGIKESMKNAKHAIQNAKLRSQN
jgi:hypothetical protein